jgi:hypothetical protein
MEKGYPFRKKKHDVEAGSSSAKKKKIPPEPTVCVGGTRPMVVRGEPADALAGCRHAERWLVPQSRDDPTFALDLREVGV